MKKTPADHILAHWPDIPGLIAVLSRLSGRSIGELERELREHVAYRVFFTLLCQAADANNFDAISRRVRTTLGKEDKPLDDLIASVAETISNIDSSEEGGKSSLNDLPYPMRRDLLRRQGDRCGVCGFHFRTSQRGERTESEATPALDHRLPFKLGGDSLENLWVLCGQCNTIKQASIHVGEQGRVWTNNYLYAVRKRAVAFWTFVRDGSCRHPGCGSGPKDVRLVAVRVHLRGNPILDNCATRCEGHVDRPALDY